MATHDYKHIEDGAVLEFDPAGDLLWVNDKSLSAADFRLDDIGNAGTSLVFSVPDKSFTVLGLNFATVDAFNVTFANGSMLVNSSASNLFADNLVGGAKNDLLIGGQAARTIGLASVRADGVQGNLDSYDPVLSADGRYVAFYSYANNLIAGDNNYDPDVFVQDTLTGALVCVSTDAYGHLSNEFSHGPSLNGDGSRVAFSSYANNLAGPDGNYVLDVFVKDLRDGSIVRASTSSAGDEGNNYSYSASLSADARYVAFQSIASNLIVGDTNGTYDIFVKDLHTGKLILASASSGGVQGNSNAYFPSLAAEGGFIAFESLATNLVGDANGVSDVFVKNLSTGALVRASVSSAAVEANGSSERASLSADGRYVAFTSYASNLVESDANGVGDIFVKDIQTGAVVRASTSSAGGQANGASDRASISADGRYVTFYSIASNLVAGDTNNTYDVFVKDLQTGAIARVSVGATGVQGDNGSYVPAISADGSTVAFYSNATNLVAGGTLGIPNTFTVSNPLETRTLSGGAGNDAYLIFRAADQVVELADEGVDTVRSHTAYTLPANVEHLELLGDESTAGTGNGLDNILTGNAGDNRLDGGAGVDSASYAAAAVAVTVNLGAGAVAQDTGAGLDTLIGIENLTGSAWDDALGGDAGANRLNGGLGADTLLGAAGDDLYIVDSAADLVLEAANSGNDIVQSYLSWTLGDNVESLTLVGSASTNATGNSLDNRVNGNAGNNVLDGGGGKDTAGYGNAKTGVVVGLDIAGPQFTNAGLDTLISIENLIGSRLDDTLHGSAGNNVLNGGEGVDTLSYARASAGITLSLAVTTAQVTGGAGSDTVSNFENLLGSGFADSLSGSSGANTLDGGLGADTMTGGAGNDLYIVENAADVVVEIAGGGTDTVQASRTYALGAEQDNLVLTGSGNFKATGNALNNVLTGNSGANILNGGDATDTVSYATAGAAVNVNLATGIATGGAGSDTLQSIERLVGSAYADTLVGGATGNRIEGGAGSDALTGDAGADTFVLSSLIGSDTVSDFLSGTDKLSIAQSTLRVGDGDTAVEGGVITPGPGGFLASAELVLLTANIAGSISAASAAAAIGSASSSYAVGQSALFAVDNGSSSALFYFSSLDSNATVSEAELTLLATLTSTPGTSWSDFVFGG